MSELVLVKLGGSLLTDKTRAAAVRTDVLERLAGEIAELAAGEGPRLLIGHGSGSYGHAVAARHGLGAEVAAGERRRGIAATQDEAARLHRLVVAALLTAGASPFGWAPSSGLTTRGGAVEAANVGPLAGALELGLLPVVYGDVVIDSAGGASICSTEHVFLALEPALAARGWPVRRAVWLGETPGVWDAEGRTVPCLDRARARELASVLAGSRGGDVTGGMAHRVEAALELAGRGIESWIVDGLESGRLAAAVRGEAGPGTVVRAACRDGGG